MIKIDGKEIRTMSEQVYKNMDDINKLEEIIKVEKKYSCSVTLSSTATTVAKSYTNAGEDVKTGWLLDPDANLFKITGGDADNLLLEFYCSMQGPSGAEVINDNTVGTASCWSSEKTGIEIDKAKDKGVYITSTQPTFDDPIYYLSTGNIDNPNTDNIIRVNDLVLYIDSDDKLKEIYQIAVVSGTTLTLTKIADVGGKQLYQHNVRVHLTIGGSATNQMLVEITNDNATPFASYNEFVTYVYNNYKNNGWATTSTKLLKASGCIPILIGGNNDTIRCVYGLYAHEDTPDSIFAIGWKSSTNIIDSQVAYTGDTYTLHDDVKPL